MENKSRGSFIKRAAILGIMCVIAISLMGILLQGCGNKTATQPSATEKEPAATAAPVELNVAMLTALTGANAAWGQNTSSGFKFGCDLINEAGGIKSLNGAKLKYSVVDTESKPETAASQMEKIAQEGVLLVCGVNQSAAALMASQIAEREKIPFLTTTDVDPQLTARGFTYTFQTPPKIDGYIRDLMAFGREIGKKTGKEPKKIAIISENSGTGVAANEAAKVLAPEYGYEIAFTALYDASKSTDFSAYISKCKSAGVDFLIGHNKPSDGISLVRAAKELDYNPLILGAALGGATSTEYIDTLGSDADYVLSTTSWSSGLKIPGLEDLNGKFMERYQKKIDSNIAAGITCAAVIADAFERAGKAEREALKAALVATDLKTGDKNYLQLKGVKFNSKGENDKAFGVVQQIKDKKWSVVYPSEYANAEAVYPKPAWTK